MENVGFDYGPSWFFHTADANDPMKTFCSSDENWSINVLVIPYTLINICPSTPVYVLLGLEENWDSFKQFKDTSNDNIK